MTELEKEILNRIINIERNNRDRLYKGTTATKTKVREEIKGIIEIYSKNYYEVEN